MPWYHTNGGRLGIGFGIALVVGLTWWGIATAQANADRLEARQETLEDYTGQIRAVSQAITQPAGDMAAVPPEPDDAALEDLAGSSERWGKTFTGAQTTLIESFPANQTLQRTNTLFQQSLQLYESAASTYGLVSRAEGKLRTDLLARAAAQRDQAAAIWGTAVAIVDAARASAEMDASGIPAPGSEAQQQPSPTELPTPAPDQTEGGG